MYQLHLPSYNSKSYQHIIRPRVNNLSFSLTDTGIIWFNMQIGDRVNLKEAFQYPKCNKKR